jgi:hypothetical protein
MAKSRAGVEGAQKILPGMELSVKTLAAPTIAQNRLLKAIEDIYSDDPAELRFLHVVLAQCGLPYREPASSLQFYEKRNGRTSLVLTPGVLLDPKTRKATMQGIPYGAKPRLLMIHLGTEAKLRKSPEVEIANSMSAFMQDLGLAVTGGKNGSIRNFKEQLNRLAATRMQLLFQDEDKVSMVNATSPISRYDVWFPKSPSQRMLWPSTVTLSNEFFESLMGQNALPLDARASVLSSSRLWPWTCTRGLHIGSVAFRATSLHQSHGWRCKPSLVPSTTTATSWLFLPNPSKLLN